MRLKVLPITQQEAEQLERLRDIPSLYTKRSILAAISEMIPRLAGFEVEEVYEEIFTR